MVSQILSALQYLHTKGIMHRQVTMLCSNGHLVSPFSPLRNLYTAWRWVCWAYRDVKLENLMLQPKDGSYVCKLIGAWLCILLPRAKRGSGVGCVGVG